MGEKRVPGNVDPQQARETTLALLDAHRQAATAHHEQRERLVLAGGHLVQTARLYGMPWVDIAHTLGVSVWAARRAARKGAL